MTAHKPYLGIQARPPRDVRRSVYAGMSHGWGRKQTARRCGITEAEVDEIMASRGQRRQSPLEGGGRLGGDTRHRSTLTPPGITAAPHTDAWFLQNQQNFVDGMRKLGMQPQETSNG